MADLDTTYRLPVVLDATVSKTTYTRCCYDKRLTYGKEYKVCMQNNQIICNVHNEGVKCKIL